MWWWYIVQLLGVVSGDCVCCKGIIRWTLQWHVSQHLMLILIWQRRERCGHLIQKYLREFWMEAYGSRTSVENWVSIGLSLTKFSAVTLIALICVSRLSRRCYMYVPTSDWGQKEYHIEKLLFCKWLKVTDEMHKEYSIILYPGSVVAHFT